jgi:hypothetical protein
MMFLISFLGFFFDRFIPTSFKFWLEFSLFCAGIGMATGSFLYLFRPQSRSTHRWFLPYRPRVTYAGRCLAARGLLLGGISMGTALLPVIQ